MREQYQMEEVSRIFALPEKYEGREVTGRRLDQEQP